MAQLQSKSGTGKPSERTCRFCFATFQDIDQAQTLQDLSSQLKASIGGQSYPALGLAPASGHADPINPPPLRPNIIKSVCDASFPSQVLDEIASLGFSRVTFVGGEPLLHPITDRLIREAKARGLDTCLVGGVSLWDTAAHCIWVEAALRQKMQGGVIGRVCLCAQVTNGSLLTEARLRALARECAKTRAGFACTPLYHRHR